MKFISIISKKVPVGNAINIASHMMAGLIAKAQASLLEDMAFINYGHAPNEHHASKWPHIILKAKNSNQITKFLEVAQENKIHYVTFVDTMLEGGWQEQQSKTIETPNSETQYLGISLFIQDFDINSMTKKLSLYS